MPTPVENQPDDIRSVAIRIAKDQHGVVGRSQLL